MCIAYSMIYFCNVIDFPINVANRPLHGPPANIPITFELAILLAGGSSFFGFFTLAGLPKPYHPVFESGAFQRASIDAYFLSIELPVAGDADQALSDVRKVGAIGAELVLESER
jgi:ActD protein